MMEWLMDKPMPIPWALVVKNASKIRLSSFGSIPMPESRTATSTSSEFCLSDRITRMPRPICDGAHRFDAVQDQIHDHLLQLDPVAHRGRQIGGQLGLDHT